jgi:hypothetical protein
VSSTWRLCRVCAHDKVIKSPLPCAYTRQRALFFSFFCCFLLIPCISNIAIDNKAYTHIIFNITSPNTTGTPQIHQTHIFMHYIESIVHPHKLHRVHSAMSNITIHYKHTIRQSARRPCHQPCPPPLPPASPSLPCDR